MTRYQFVMRKQHFKPPPLWNNMTLKSMDDKYKYTDYHKVIQLFDV